MFVFVIHSSTDDDDDDDDNQTLKLSSFGMHQTIKQQQKKNLSIYDQIIMLDESKIKHKDMEQLFNCSTCILPL